MSPVPVREARERSLVESAQAVAESAVRRFPQIEAVALFGSVARGDDREDSDLDLMLVSTHSAPKPTDVIAAAPEQLADRISAFSFSEARFGEVCDRGGLIVLHLRHEHVPLYDPTGFLRRRLAGASTSVDHDLARLAESLRVYDDLVRFNGSFLFCLSHVYVLGKRAAMLALASSGSPEFNRDRIFDDVGARFPETRASVDQVARLRPFFKLAAGKPSGALPFSYDGCAGQVADARESVRRIAELASLR